MVEQLHCFHRKFDFFYLFFRKRRERLNQLREQNSGRNDHFQLSMPLVYANLDEVSINEEVESYNFEGPPPAYYSIQESRPPSYNTATRIKQKF